MDFGIGTYLLGYAAGVLSTLSPCVLPLLPILIATVVADHHWGPLALATGLTVSFVVFGLFFATIGISIGMDQGLPRKGAAVLLMVFGAFLLSSWLQDRFEQATAGLSAAGDRLIHRIHAKTWLGHFAMGLCLGLVWTPCVGPTVGAATTLASQQTQLLQVALLMVLFGIGASTPLLVLGGLSRKAFARVRGPLLRAGRTGKRLLGGFVLILGAAILTGLDKGVEAWLIDRAPQWLIDLSTKY
ncbi:MAG: cytochrome c biogenesis CcdA family protein [Rhizobacter sp.]|nr:cytochrome c biogenesis CcdA family protein [Rhizobacter sp.]